MRRFLTRIPDGGGQLILLTDPASLPNLELYLRSDSSDINALANGATVSTWSDQSGHNRGIFGIYNGTPKKVSAASPNGLALISIGANTGMAGTDFGNTGIGTANGLTIYCYYEQDTLVDGGIGEFLVDWPQTAHATAIWAMSDDGAKKLQAQAGNPAPFIRDGIASLGFHILALRCQPPQLMGAADLWIDGSRLATTAVQNGALNGPYQVGCSTGGNTSLTGKVGAVIAYSVAHSTSTLIGVTNFLRKHWG